MTASGPSNQDICSKLSSAAELVVVEHVQVSLSQRNLIVDNARCADDLSSTLLNIKEN